MKKIFLAICVLLVMATNLSSAYVIGQAFEQRMIPGDINGDQVADTSDVRIILKKSLFFEDGFTQEERLSGDVNGDGAVNSVDARLIMRGCITDYYTVTFRDYDGTVLKTETVAKGDAATAPIDPSRNGYMFVGWDTAFDDVLSNLVVTATYTANYHTIYYYDWNGTCIKEEQFTEDAGLFDLYKPEMVGYRFVGWYTAPNGGGTFIDSIEQGTTRDLKLYVCREIETYTIYFHNAPENSNATSSVNTRQYTVEDRIVLTEPKWSGLKFVNWTDENGNEWTEIPKGTVGDLNLTANWTTERNLAASYDDTHAPEPLYYDPVEKMYFFTYKLGTLEHVVLDEFVLGDNLKYNTQSADMTFSLTETVTVEEAVAETVGEIVSESVSTSKEWSISTTEAHGSSTEQHFDVTAGIEIGKDSWPVKGKLEASYGNSYTHTQDYSSTEVDGGATVNGSETIKESSVSVSYLEQISSSVTKEITISADKPKGYYSYVRACNVTVVAVVAYNAKTGNYSLFTQCFVDNMHEMPLYYPTLEELENPPVETLPYDVPMEDIIDYIDRYCYVNYDGNGGTYAYSDLDSDMVIDGMPMSVYEWDSEKTLPENLYSRTGYVFEGWALSADGEKVYDDGAVLSAMQPGETMTLYACWSLATYDVAFDYGAENVKTTLSVGEEPYPDQVTYAQSFRFPAPTAPYYRFLGWYTADGRQLTDAEGQSLEVWDIVENTTVYAHWEQTEPAYIYVTTVEDFKAISGSGQYLLLNDLDFANEEYASAIVAEFAGELHGNGKSIKNLKMKPSTTSAINTDRYYGLFGKLSSANIHDLNVYNMTIEFATQHSGNGWVRAGMIVGTGSGTLTNINLYDCTMVVGRDNAVLGGVAGTWLEGTISNCIAYGIHLKGNGDMGGIVGHLKGTVENCYVVQSSTRRVSIYHYAVASTRSTGGICGYGDGGKLIQCAVNDTDFYLDGDLSKQTNMGIIVGNQEGGCIHSVGSVLDTITKKASGSLGTYTVHWFAVGWGYAGRINSAVSVK